MNNQKPTHHIFRLPEGAGKCNIELQRITHPSGDENYSAACGTILFILTQYEIEYCKLDRLLAAFAPSMAPGELKALRGKVAFVIEGYEDRSIELYEIPAVRKFINHANVYWGGWFYFAELQTSCLKVIACCMANHLLATKQEGSPTHDVRVLRAELDAWGEYCAKEMMCFDSKTGISRNQGAARLHQVNRYLGME